MRLRVTPGGVAALAGAADTAQFLARRPQMFREARGRAFGSVLGLGLWLGAAAGALASRETTNAELGLAGVLVAGNVALVVMHVRAHVASPRVFLGAGAAGVVLADAIRRR